MHHIIIVMDKISTNMPQKSSGIFCWNVSDIIPFTIACINIKIKIVSGNISASFFQSPFLQIVQKYIR